MKSSVAIQFGGLPRSRLAESARDMAPSQRLLNMK